MKRRVLRRRVAAGVAGLPSRPPLTVPPFDRTTLARRFAGTLSTGDARRHPHSVLRNLRLCGGRHVGPVSARTLDEPIHLALSALAALTRKRTAA